MGFWKRLFGNKESNKSKAKQQITDISSRTGDWSGIRVIEILIEGPDRPPDEWVQSILGPYDVSEASVQLMDPGGVPENLAFAFGLVERLRQLGSGPSPDLGNIEAFESGIIPDGRRYAVLGFK
jgi:hypothetical protein